MGKRLNTKTDGALSGPRHFLGENKFIILAFIVSASVMLFIYYCFELFPFGDATILRMDLYHQYGPLFAEFYERITGLRSMLYSWNSGLGGGFLGNYSNYLSSPFSFIILFFGHKNMPEAIATIILLKGAFASASFAYYLKRSQGHNDASISAFGLLYSFSGFFIAYYWNVMWLDAMVLFPLAMLGIELIIKNKKFGLFVFALTMTMLTSYYMAYMVCLFSILFYLVTYFGNYSFSSVYDSINKDRDSYITVKPSFWKRLRHSRFLGSGMTFALSGLLSFGLAAALLLPVYFTLKASSATGNSMPFTFTSYYTIFDFLANHLASVEPTIRSSGKDVLPNVYCGLATILLVPLYLFAKSISSKEKVAYVGLLGFLYFSFNINYANFVWHAFHFPNDLPYRFSFMYSFILLIIAYKAYVRLKEFTAKEILSVGVAAVFAIVMIQKIGSKNVGDITIIAGVTFVVLYTMLFAMQSRGKFPSAAFALLILCSFTAEACISDTDHFSMGQGKSAYTEDLPDFQTLKTKLDEHDGGFYRMELTSLRTRMDPCLYDYNGVSTFSSMASEKLSNLESRLGMASNYINSYTYNPQTPVYNAMHSLKYIVNNKENLEMNPVYYNMLFSKDKFTAFENRYSLPIAYCADTSLVLWDHSSDNPFVVQADYFKKATGSENPFVQLPITDAEYMNVDEIYSGFDTGEFYFYKTAPDSDASVTFIITPEQTQSCYIYVKSSHVDKIVVSSGDYVLTHNDDRGAIIDIGMRQAGEEIMVELPISEGKSGNISLYAYGLDTAKFVEGYKILKAGELAITTFKETHIVGTVNAPSNCILYTSIPYDEGWSVTVNGEKVDSSKLLKIGDALLGIPLFKEGANTIELKYMPKGLSWGIYISVVTLIALILFLIIQKSFRRLDEKHRDYPHPTADFPDIPPIEAGRFDYESFGLDQQEDPDADRIQETWPRDFDEPEWHQSDTEQSKSREIIEEDLDIIIEELNDE